MVTRKQKARITINQSILIQQNYVKITLHYITLHYYHSVKRDNRRVREFKTITKTKQKQTNTHFTTHLIKTIKNNAFSFTFNFRSPFSTEVKLSYRFTLNKCRLTIFNHSQKRFHISPTPFGCEFDLDDSYLPQCY